jgi:hypothetical protein
MTDLYFEQVIVPVGPCLPTLMLQTAGLTVRTVCLYARRRASIMETVLVLTGTRTVQLVKGAGFQVGGLVRGATEVPQA